MKRLFWIVLDSVGIGALPDAAEYQSEGANTLGHVLKKTKLRLPNMARMGLGQIEGVPYPEDKDAMGAAGRAMEKAKGKDTTTGHWEMTGVTLHMPFPTYPDGFPQEIIASFEKAIGCPVLGNCVASGTEVLKQLGKEHLKTGHPIVYTSADSVFQIACHERLWPVDKLYHICHVARELLSGRHAVGRVIARPFVGESADSFTRTGNRRDFSLAPTGRTVLDALKGAGYTVMGVGKIEDIFCMRGLTESVHSAGNAACLEQLRINLEKDFTGLCFVNLVDYDMSYGHRNDVEGYAAALAVFDNALPDICKMLGEDDMLLITADHGCDPTTPGTDHTREYVPILWYSPRMTGFVPLGTRQTYADMAATVAEGFGLPDRFGATSFWNEIKGAIQ